MPEFLGFTLTIIHAILATAYIAESGREPPHNRLILHPAIAWPVAIISFLLLQKILRGCGINVFEGATSGCRGGPY